MTIIALTPPCLNSVTQLTRLLANLDPQPQATLRRLTHVLRPPIDAPRAHEVIGGAVLCVIAFGETLTNPNETFVQINAEIRSLYETVRAHPKWFKDESLERPLQRRLTKYASWGLCMSLAKSSNSKQFFEAAGVEILLSMATGKPFPNAYANDIRRALNSEPTFGLTNLPQHFQKNQYSFTRHFEKAQRDAQLLFESSTSDPTQATGQSCFELSARQYLLQNQTHASPNHRRGILDYKCQSKIQVVQSSSHLRMCAEQGEDTALLAILAICSGISPELVMKMPLIQHAQEDWLMTIDPEAGLIKTNIELLFPHSASPTTASAENHRPANKIIVKPMPRFIASLLSDRIGKMPHARTINELVRNADTSGKALTQNAPSKAGIAPSISRLLNSISPFAIQIGLNRLVTAFITNDFSIVPSARPYYAQIEREEIWAASSTLFNSLKWGEPVAMKVGLAVGCRIAAKPEAIARLYRWMVDEVQTNSPGKRYTFSSLSNHHNAYAKFSATIAILCLANREAHELSFTAQGVRENLIFTTLFDKKTGPYPGHLPVPINMILSDQIRLWYAHCSALNRRLEKLGIPKSSKLRAHLIKVINHAPVSLFFTIYNEHKPVPIGSMDLTKWWPDHLTFATNFSRSFWQVEFHKAGLKGSLIDMFVRHQLLGFESHTSTSHMIIHDCFVEICRVQQEVLHRLCITPIAGLSKQ